MFNRLTLFLCLVLIAVACSTGEDEGRAPLDDRPDKDVEVPTIPSSTVAETAATAVETTATTAATTTTVADTTTTTAPSTTTTVAIGSLASPVPAGEPTIVGEWEVTVLSVIRDGTDLVLEENQFNDPPPEGRQFTLVRVAVRYIGSATDSVFSGVTFSTVGPGAVAYDFEDSCGVIPDDLSSFREVFPGGVLIGNQCWAVTPEDAAGLVLFAEPAFSFDDDQTFFALPDDGVEFPVIEQSIPEPVDDGPGSRGNPIPAETVIQVGEWTVVLSEGADITEAVMAENQFNDPPPDGHLFFGVRVSATYSGSDSTTFIDGVSVTSVGASAVAYDFEATCGVIPEPLDQFADVFSGGTLEGWLCWAVAEGDVDSLVAIVDGSFGVDVERQFASVR